ncbi:RING finger protein nhl-1 [Dufourea novaeangliae]|uniref:RING finger protein nhl-1 n=1 Tax=Dufourea novaeangliae TaxID=178035 RepID=A0A154PF38_DUFNO|nr:RING finger protein nhl-1 [Dufourea novaeangliae]
MEQFEQLLTCAICLDRYRNPKLLPCQHSFCMEPCMDGLVDYVRRQVKCPECRAEHRIPYQGVQAFPTNVTLQRFLELHIEITGELPDPTSGQTMERCGVCSEKSYCSLCVHCEKKCCPECKDAHMDILRREITRINSQIRRGLHRLQDALALVEKNTLGLQTNCASVAEEVDEIYRRLSKALKDRTEHLRNEVDRYLSTELRGLIQLKENLELEIANIQSNCDLAEAHINENVPWDDSELLDTKELFLRTVEFIRNFEYEAGDYSRRVRFVMAHDPNQLVLHVAGYGELNIKPETGTGGLLGSSSSLAPPGGSPGLMRSKSDHRLASQYRQQEEERLARNRYVPEYEANILASKLESSPLFMEVWRKSRTPGEIVYWTSYARNGLRGVSECNGNCCYDAPEYEVPRNKSRYRSRFMRHRDGDDSDGDTRSTVRFTSTPQDQSGLRERVLDTEDAARGPLSGIFRLTDSPRVMKKLQDYERAGKRKKEEPPPHPVQQTPTPKPQVQVRKVPTAMARQTSEDDEISRIKKQNKTAATPATETVEERQPAPTPVPTHPAPREAPTERDTEEPTRRPMPTRRTSTDTHTPATRSASSDSSTGSESSGGSGIRNTGAPFTAEEMKQKYLSRAPTSNTTTAVPSGQGAQTPTKDSGTASPATRSFQSRFLGTGNRTAPPPPTPTPREDTVIKKKEEEEDEDEETSSSSEDTEYTSPRGSPAHTVTSPTTTTTMTTTTTSTTTATSGAATTPVGGYTSRTFSDGHDERATVRVEDYDIAAAMSADYDSHVANGSMVVPESKKRNRTDDSTDTDETFHHHSSSSSLATRPKPVEADSGHDSRVSGRNELVHEDALVDGRSGNDVNSTLYARTDRRETVNETPVGDRGQVQRDQESSTEKRSQETTMIEDRESRESSSYSMSTNSECERERERDADTEVDSPLSARSRYAALKERRQRLARSRSSHNFGGDDLDLDEEPPSPTTQSPNAYLAAKYGAGSELARSRSTHALKSREPSPERDRSGTEKDGAALSSWARYLKNKYGNRTIKDKEPSSSTSTIPSSSSSATSRRLSLGLPLRHAGQTSFESSDDDQKNPSGSPTSPTAAPVIPAAAGSSTSNGRRSHYLLKRRQLFKFGMRGSEAGCFTWPRGLAVGPDNSIVVADSSNHRVQVFDCNGNFMKEFGSYGSGEGEFDCLAGVAVNRIGQYIIADRYNHRIQVLDPSGRFLRAFGSQGTADGRFNYPWGITTDALGFIYVCDKENHRVQVFQSDGTFVGKFGSCGSGRGQLEHPHYIAVSNTNRVIVSDGNNHRVQIFDVNGRVLTSFGSEGSDEGQFKFPRGVAVDDQGYIVVADSGNNRIQIFSPEGAFLKSFGGWGSGDGEFKGLEGVAVTSTGNIVVCDRENHRVQVF